MPNSLKSIKEMSKDKPDQSAVYMSSRQTHNPNPQAVFSPAKLQDSLDSDASCRPGLGGRSNWSLLGTCSRGSCFSDTFNNLPSSSTPDLIGSSKDSSYTASSSPDIPLTQVVFTSRLHSLLQVIQDQQSEDSSDFSQDTSEDEVAWITVSHGERNQEGTIRNGSMSPSIKTHSHDSSDEGSNNSSANSLGVWGPSPHDVPTAIYEDHRGIPLTHYNKRKHDDSHEPSGNGQSNEYSPNVLHVVEGHASSKKAKYSRLGTSTSLSCSYQTGSASYRKSRSLTTASLSAGSASRCIEPSRCLSYPIVHPPIDLLHKVASPHGIAEARVHALLKRERLYRTQDGLPVGSFELAAGNPSSNDPSEHIFGIEADLRREVVQWIFEVLPPRSVRNKELYRHLTCSKETRFHAMYLFSRYVLRVGERREICPDKESNSMRERYELIWDIAFCCLAISIKFHRDFLHPLSPIYSKEFMVISPQLLSCDEFERTQRDVLEAVNYEIFAVTPHALFEELWAALPSLQNILDFKRPREIVCDEMWAKLQRASLELDMMRFPISFLTAAALVEGIIVALLDEYQQDNKTATSSRSSSTNTSLDDVDLEKVNRDVVPICGDVTKLLGMTMADLRACRRWMIFR